MKIQLFAVLLLGIALGAMPKLVLAQRGDTQHPPKLQTTYSDVKQFNTEQRQSEARAYDFFQELQKQPSDKLHYFGGQFAEL